MSLDLVTIPHALQSKNQNKKWKHIVRDSIKTLKMDHIKRSETKNQKELSGCVKYLKESVPLLPIPSEATLDS